MKILLHVSMCLVTLFTTQSHTMQNSSYKNSPLSFFQRNDLENLKKSIETDKRDINEIIRNTTVLIEAVQYGTIETVEYLLEKGANFQMSFDCGDHKKTAFYCAAINGKLAIMQLLVERGVNLKQENSANDLLRITCQKHKSTTYQKINLHDIIKQLILWNFDLTPTNVSGMTSLHFLVQNADNTDQELIQLFLDRQVSINIRDKSGYTPLMMACCYNNKEIIPFLLQRGADIHAKNSFERTALFCGMRHSVMTKIFLEHGANLNSKDIEGNTVLHVYLRGQKKEKHPCMQLLLPWFENPHNHIDINAQNKNGNTALHLAAASYQRDSGYIVPLLLFYGAEESLIIKNKFGKTPADCAPEGSALKGLLKKDHTNNSFLEAYNPHTKEKEKGYSLGEYEKKELLPYTLSPMESIREDAIIRHNAKQPTQETMKPRTTITRRLRDREYGKKMHERLYT